MALIRLADELLLEIMKTQSHFLNWIYRSSKCLSLWPVSLLERECFFLLTYLQRVIKGFYSSAEGQGPSCHTFCSACAGILKGHVWEGKVWVIPSTVVLFTPWLPSLELKGSWEPADGMTEWSGGRDVGALHSGQMQVIRWSIFWLRQCISICSQIRDLKSSFTDIGWKKSFCHLCMTMYLWLHSLYVDLIPVTDVLAMIQGKFK